MSSATRRRETSELFMRTLQGKGSAWNRQSAALPSFQNCGCRGIAWGHPIAHPRDIFEDLQYLTFSHSCLWVEMRAPHLPLYSIRILPLLRLDVCSDL